MSDKIIKIMVSFLPLVLIVGTGFLLIQMSDFKDSDECGRSPFNKYSNETWAKRSGDKCFVRGYGSYTTNEVCKGGFLGIGQSCYESKEERLVYTTHEICFNINTGERC